MKTVSFVMSLLIVMSVGICSQANAQTQFIKYKKYLIPITNCDDPKIIISMDYGDWDDSNSTTGTSGDADEVSSFTHFLAYSNEFDVRGIIASDTIGQGDVNRINDHLDAYKQDYDAYSWGNKGYKSSTDLKLLVRQGIDITPKSNPTDADNPTYNSNASLNNSAVNLIVAEAKLASSACPVNIAVWGGILEVTAALERLRIDSLNSGTDYRGNLNIVATGSSNRKDVEHAWDKTSDTTLLGSAKFVGMIDRYRALMPIGCTKETDHDPVVYLDGQGNNVTTEDILDDLTDQPANRTQNGTTLGDFPVTKVGMKGLLQKARYYMNQAFCGGVSVPPYMKTLKAGDTVTTLYFLDGPGLGIFSGYMRKFVQNAPDGNRDGAVDEIENINNEGVNGRKLVFEHYRARMNELYSN